ncbi:Uu.00g116450.m01.CDS01 [Anthostomella pinea]|uniref:Uu.00g116450.m01.CDS01 n=1 Tax=Anthostomella pinea TaxID=933095 RepID=A0AAI8VGJ4_9PEZI|nr:Uu.00g116450.m01.CDS01 [Anthostomella pinea]
MKPTQAFICLGLFALRGLAAPAPVPAAGNQTDGTPAAPYLSPREDCWNVDDCGGEVCPYDWTCDKGSKWTGGFCICSPL